MTTTDQTETPTMSTESERPASTVQPVDTADAASDAGAGARARARNTLAALGDRLTHGDWLAEFDPPNLWVEQRPSLSATWLYARYGEQAPEGGLGRWLCLAWAWLSLPARAVLLTFDWLIERPARTAVALVLYAIFAQVPVVREILLAPDWIRF